jgi:hypothetical protein
MNRRGSLGIAIVTAIFVFIVGLAVINLILPEVTNFRTDMDCSNAAGITDGTKLTCLIGDTIVPYFILLILSVTIGGIVERLLI